MVGQLKPLVRENHYGKLTKTTCWGESYMVSHLLGRIIYGKSHKSTCWGESYMISQLKPLVGENHIW